MISCLSLVSRFLFWSFKFQGIGCLAFKYMVVNVGTFNCKVNFTSFPLSFWFFTNLIFVILYLVKVTLSSLFVLFFSFQCHSLFVGSASFLSFYFFFLPNRLTPWSWVSDGHCIAFSSVFISVHAFLSIYLVSISVIDQGSFLKARKSKVVRLKKKT